jgi:6-phosphogluconolactonase (cycloisomerase 2 family)
MRLLLLLAGVLAASPAFPASILYATAASEQRIDGFCLRGDGSISPRTVSVQTGGSEPRRLLVTENGANRVLYVAEADRVEAFRIGDHGHLSLIGATRLCPEGGQCTPVDVRDIEVSTDFTRLYVVHREYSRIAAYPLGPDGAPEKDFTSCIQGSFAAGYHEIEIDRARSLLYVTADGSPDRIDVHAIVGGDLPALPVACTKAQGTDRDLSTVPLSRRLRLDNPKAFALDGDILYVEQRGSRQITAFQLQPDGTFCDNFTITRVGPDGQPVLDAEGNPEEINQIEGCETTPSTELCTTWCGGFDQAPGRTSKCENRNANANKPEERVLAQKVQHCPLSATDGGVQYQGLILHRGAEGKTVIGSQFFRGRVDAFLLRADGALPRKATRKTPEDLRMSPVGLAAVDNENTLYVAAGEHDRVVAYRLTRQGVLAGGGPFSETDEEKNSFPNAIAIATLEAGCR